MFHVKVAGVHRYSVRIPTQTIFNRLGDELDGLAIESRRLILISPEVSPDRREEILWHEVQHAWEFHVPAPNCEESRAQLAATIGQALREDLDRQGGIEALKAITPEPLSLPYRPPPERQNPASSMPSLDRWECQCGTVTICGSIHTGAVDFHDGLQQHHVQRWFRCDSCGGLMTWTEVATPDGKPVGTLCQVPAPKRLFGREAAKFEAERLAVV